MREGARGGVSPMRTWAPDSKGMRWRSWGRVRREVTWDWERTRVRRQSFWEEDWATGVVRREVEVEGSNPRSGVRERKKGLRDLAFMFILSS